MMLTHVKTSFEMQDGRILHCSYEVVYFAASYDDPPDCEVGEPTYCIDDSETDYNTLPKGLKVIADKLCTCGLGQFDYSETD